MFKSNRLLGATLLVSGTCIGAGMLALPVSTATYGLIPSSVLFIACWAAMAFAGLLILEVALWMESHCNLITMADITLGKTGKVIAWTAYLFLLYCLMSAYLSGINSIILSATEHLLHEHINTWLSSASIIVLFALIVYLGAKPIDYMNRLLIIGLILCYGALIGFVGPHVDVRQLAPMQFKHAWLTLPIIITSFGFHIIIPSIRTYLNSDTKKLRHAILLGSTLPLLIYIVWELLIFGVIPLHGENGLLSMAESGQPAIDITRVLHAILNNAWLDDISNLFAFFLIATSFIGVSFSLFDFLSDGLHIKRKKLGRMSITAITFIPPLLFTHLYPNAFITALGFAGIFVALLLCILPAMMVWSGRYWRNIATGYRAPGGKLALALLMLFAIMIIFIELL